MSRPFTNIEFLNFDVVAGKMEYYNYLWVFKLSLDIFLMDNDNFLYNEEIYHNLTNKYKINII